MSEQIIYQIQAVGLRLNLKDPFIFAAHHLDHYPAGNEHLGPISPAKHQEYDMYYGEIVPGFPEHPHTGFETITIVEQGIVDHFDSLGNSGRYGAGDVQWLSTGNGVEHCEMFPLIHEEQDNPLELFQIWFNSSAEQKKQDPDYKMFWREDIPKFSVLDKHQHAANIRVISGRFQDTIALARPQHSWAASDKNRVNIYMIRLDPYTEFSIPATTSTSTRFCYFYRGDELYILDQAIDVRHLVELKPDYQIDLKAGSQPAYILWLEGEPIAEPVAMRGPFVLNTPEELDAAFQRYRSTQFGGWPWPHAAPVFERDTPRFASYEGGKRREFPEDQD